MKVTPRYDGPPIITIERSATPRDDAEPVRRQRRRMEAMLRDLPPEEWNAPSRCEDWSVQDVVAHLISVNAFWQTSVAAGLAGTPTRFLVGFDPAATPPLLVAPMRALSPGEVLAQFVESNDAFLATVDGLDEAAWSMLAEAPPGHISIRLLAHHALWDCWVHERDIALALGSEPPVEPDEVRACLWYAAALGAAFTALAGGPSIGGPSIGTVSIETTDPALRCNLVVGESVTIHEDPQSTQGPCLRGDAVELVEALSLRSPLPSSTPDEWRHLAGALATLFDVASTAGESLPPGRHPPGRQL